MPHSILQHGRKHRLEIASRATDNLQHLRGSRLLLQRFCKVGRRWRSSLSSRAFSMAMTAWAAKFCDQFDLFVGEGTNFLPVNAKNADQLVVLEHRHYDDGPHATKFDACNALGWRSRRLASPRGRRM